MQNKGHWNLTGTKSAQELSCARQLSNGQVVKVFAEVESMLWFNGEKTTQITISCCIGKNARECNDWFRSLDKKLWNKSTGRCGLEGLRCVLDAIKQVEDLVLEGWIPCNKRVFLCVQGSDKKRERAYARLTKHGFTWVEDGYYKWIRK
jgi:hypothetical protein